MKNVAPVTALRWLDFSLGAGSLLYGMYAGSWFWIIGGVLGLVLAWINPGKRIRAFLFVRLRRPQEPVIEQAKPFPEPPSAPYQRRKEKSERQASA